MTPARKLKYFREANPHTFKLWDSLLKNITWNELCLLPTSAVIEAMTKEGTQLGNSSAEIQEYILEMSPVIVEGICLYAWEKTKGVYLYNDIIYDEIIKTPLGNIPVDALKRLPEWCVYIRTKDILYDDGTVGGFWAWLDQNKRTSNLELRLLFLLEDGNTALHFVSLAYNTVGESLEATYRAYDEQTLLTAEQKAVISDLISTAIKLTAYICSDEADIIGTKFVQGKGKQRKALPDFPNEWKVGERIGAAINKYKIRYEYENTSDSVNKVRPHTRKAHWHHFWTGSADNKKLICKWLPPIPVGWSWDDENKDFIPVTIHPVKNKSY